MEGKVGVIYSIGHGAGWSTWGSREQALDQELANALYNSAEYEVLEEIATRNWPDACILGLEDCVVEWVDPGTAFTIEEYDGSESLVLESDDYWMIAK